MQRSKYTADDKKELDTTRGQLSALEKRCRRNFKESTDTVDDTDTITIDTSHESKFSEE